MAATALTLEVRGVESRTTLLNGHAVVHDLHVHAPARSQAGLAVWVRARVCSPHRLPSAVVALGGRSAMLRAVYLLTLARVLRAARVPRFDERRTASHGAGVLRRPWHQGNPRTVKRA